MRRDENISRRCTLPRVLRTRNVFASFKLTQSEKSELSHMRKKMRQDIIRNYNTKRIHQTTEKNKSMKVLKSDLKIGNYQILGIKDEHGSCTRTKMANSTEDYTMML